MSQLRKNLLMMGALAVIAGGVGLYAYFGVHKTAEREEHQKAEAEKLVSLGPAEEDGDADAGTQGFEVTKLVITAKGDVTTLQKRDGKWRITAPLEAEADSFAVDSVTSQLQTGKFKDTVEEKPTAEDLKKYGLDQPRFTVVATVQPKRGGAAKEITLHGGIENTFDGSIYVQRGGDPKVYSVQGGIRWNLEKSTFDLRNKKVLAVPEKEVRKIEVAGGAHPFVVEKDAEGNGWRLVKPEAQAADPQAVTLLLGGLGNVAATAFHPDSPAERTKWGLDKPVLTATFTLASGTPVRLDFSRGAAQAKGADAGAPALYVLRTEGGNTVLAELPSNGLAGLEKDPSELRDKTVVRFDKDKVARIAFVKDGSKIVVERLRTDAGNSEDWRVVEPQQGPAKKWKLSSILWTLGSLKAKSFGEESPKSWAKWGLDKPEREVQLLDSAGNLLARLAVGREVEGKADTRYVRGSRDQVMELETGRLQDLPGSVDDLLDRPAPPAPKDGGTK